MNGSTNEDLRKQIQVLEEDLFCVLAILLRECPQYEDWTEKHWGDLIDRKMNR